MSKVIGSEFLSESYSPLTSNGDLVAMFGLNAISTLSTSDSVVLPPNYVQDLVWLRLSYGIGTPYSGTGAIHVKGFEPGVDKVYLSWADQSSLYGVYYDRDRDGYRDTVIGKTSSFMGRGSLNDEVIVFSGRSPSQLGMSYDYGSRKYKIGAFSSSFLTDLSYTADRLQTADTNGYYWD
jgi:hypothetical protein